MDDRNGGFFASLKEALRGSERDFTSEPIGRAVLLLAVPMVLEMAMESVFAVVDVFVVSRLGAEAVAVVSLTESMLMIIYAVGIGLSIGATAVVSRRTGEKDPEGAARAGAMILVLGILMSLPIAAAGIAFAPGLLRIMGGSDWVVAHGATYARVMFGSTISIMLLFLVNAIFRGSGDAATAMRTLWIANGMNLVLAPCLVLGLGPFPRLGLTGAAIATTIGRSTGVLYQLWRLFSGKGRVTVRIAHLTWNGPLIAAMLRLSGSGMLQAIIGMASWIPLVRIVSRFGSEALAGYTIAIRIVLFALLPSWGLSNAAATLVGQNLGAGNPARAEQAVWRAGLYNLVFLGAVGACFVAFAPGLIALFTSDPVVAGHATRCLRIVSAGFPLYAYGMVMSNAFNGAGWIAAPTLINLFCFWILELPLAWFLAITAGMGPTGPFIAVAAAFSSLALVSGVLFKGGRWKLKRV